ncbi:MAG: hypothetical protein MUE81_09935 [Thermoflexibacter sp.]|jgi:hypothetical protein|nr:hypothetical protein [Thermoflexibacter sp.]
MKNLLFLLIPLFFFACRKQNYIAIAPLRVQEVKLIQLKKPIVLPSRNFYPTRKIEKATILLTDEQLYEQAYKELERMLQGRQKVDFKRAVFITENAYLDNQLDYKGFCQVIKDITQLVKIVKSNITLDYELKDKEAVLTNAAIFRYLSDTLSTKDDLVKILPYQYDFEDFAGEKNWERMFVSKLLVSKSGNCHSLPFLYKILADELGAPAWLALAPHHLYIKCHSKKTQFYNTELTSKTFPIDAWIMASGYVSYQNIMSGIYMDTLSQKQSIALTLVDLAKGYERKNPTNHENFALKCTNLALRYFPNCINAMLLKAETMRKIYEKSKDNMIYTDLEQLCTTIFNTGYAQMPEEMYVEWLMSSGDDKYQDQKKHLYEPTKANNYNYGTNKPILTLSNGRYEELHHQKRHIHISSIIFDTQEKKISGFAKIEKGKITRISPEIISRFFDIVLKKK